MAAEARGKWSGLGGRDGGGQVVRGRERSELMRRADVFLGQMQGFLGYQKDKGEGLESLGFLEREEELVRSFVDQGWKCLQSRSGDVSWIKGRMPHLLRQYKKVMWPWDGSRLTVDVRLGPDESFCPVLEVSGSGSKLEFVVTPDKPVSNDWAAVYFGKQLGEMALVEDDRRIVELGMGEPFAVDRRYDLVGRLLGDPDGVGAGYVYVCKW